MRLQNPSCIQIIDAFTAVFATSDVKNVFGFWVFLRRPKESALSSLSRLYNLGNLLGNKRSWFVLWGSRSVLCVSVFQGSLLLKFSVRSHVFEKHTLAVVFCLLYTETWQV